MGQASRAETWGGIAIALITAIAGIVTTQLTASGQDQQDEQIYTALRDSSVKQAEQIVALKEEIKILREDSRDLRDWLRTLVSEEAAGDDDDDEEELGTTGAGPVSSKAKPTVRPAAAAKPPPPLHAAKPMPPPPPPLPAKAGDLQQQVETGGPLFPPEYKSLPKK